MIRMIGLLGVIALLSACSGDGRGSQYSSARAQTAAVAYTPVTSQGQQILTGPIAVTPGAVPVTTQTGQSSLVTTATLPSASPAVVRFATGPIYSACLGAGRQGATETRCGCVQWVADQQLSAAHQRRGAEYFEKQHDLQEVRQSDQRSNEEFWTAWQAFGSSAGSMCRGT